MVNTNRQRIWFSDRRPAGVLAKKQRQFWRTLKARFVSVFVSLPMRKWKKKCLHLSYCPVKLECLWITWILVISLTELINWTKPDMYCLTLMPVSACLWLSQFWIFIKDWTVNLYGSSTMCCFAFNNNLFISLYHFKFIWLQTARNILSCSPRLVFRNNNLIFVRLIMIVATINLK